MPPRHHTSPTQSAYASVCQRLISAHANVFGRVPQLQPLQLVDREQTPKGGTTRDIAARLAAMNQQALDTLRASDAQVAEAVQMFLRWMEDGVVVRVIGAGRARLAASMPASRMAHGGARVYVQDDIIPMPHTIKGGGIVAASASGKTESVLATMRSAREQTHDVRIVGIADSDASEFKSLCDVFIGIAAEAPGQRNPLRALADSEEYVISELLDAMVVAAGQLGGFSETHWKLGHENLGPTGPYDHVSSVR